MEEVIDPGTEYQPDNADPVAALDHLAVIEAELLEAEAELDSMDNASVDQDPSTDL